MKQIQRIEHNQFSSIKGRWSENEIIKWRVLFQNSKYGKILSSKYEAGKISVHYYLNNNRTTQMKKSYLNNYLRTLLEICTISAESFLGYDRWKSFSSKKFDIGFVDEDNDKFEGILAKIQRHEQGLTKKEISSEVIRILEDALLNNKICDDKIDTLLKKWNSMINQDWFVASPIQGIIKIETPLPLGSFTIYDCEKDAEVLEDLLVFSDGRNPKNYISGYIVGTNITSKSKARAVECAREQFLVFENALRFVLNEDRLWSSFGIVNYNAPHYNPIAVCNPSGYAIQNYHDSADYSETLTFEKLNDKSFGYHRIWDIVSSQNRNEIEHRIFRSVQWIGHALNDYDKSRAFLLLLIATESILKFDDDRNISPSITHSMSESVAFIMSTDPSKRKKIFKEVIELYRIRSKIVHGGITGISDNEFHSIRYYSRQVIIRLLTVRGLKRIQGKQNLKDFILAKRFK